MRVWQFGRHIEPEVFIVINVRVSKANEHSSTTDESLFQKDGFQSWIQDLSKLKHQNKNIKNKSLNGWQQLFQISWASDFTLNGQFFCDLMDIS